MHYKFSAIVEKEGSIFVALCPELDVASQGTTLEEAIANLKEAVQLYVEEADPAELKKHTTPPYITTLDIAV